MEEVQYKVGDLVNGQVWTGTAWLQLNHGQPNGESTAPQPAGAAVDGQRWDSTRGGPTYQAVGPMGGPKRPWYRTSAGIIGIALSGIVVLSVAGASLGTSDGGPAADTVGSQDSVTANAPQYAAPQPQNDTPDEVAVPAGATRVNQWAVKVADVDPDASAAIEDANQFNEDPTYGYIIVTLEGTNGADAVKNLQSFTVKLQGSNKTIYRDQSLFMVMPQELASEAAPGGTVQAQFVFDIPPSALGEGALLLVDDVPVALP